MKLPWRQRFFKHEAAPPPRDCHEQWRAHPRLQGHLRAFLCRDAGTVVEVYNRRAPRLDRQGLLRATCHVAAWVALLPLEQASCPAGKSQLSPLSLLVLFLKRRGKARVTPWLWGILQLVAIRLQTFEQTVRETNHRDKPTLNGTQKQWKQLRKVIPPCIWRSLQQQGQGHAESIDRNSSSVPAAHDRTDVAGYEPHPCVELEAESRYIFHRRERIVNSSPAALDTACSAQQDLIRGVGNQMDIQSHTNQRDDGIVISSPTPHDSTDAAQQDHPLCVGDEAEGHSRLNEAETRSVEQTIDEQLRFSENESKALCTHWQDERSNSSLRRATGAAKLLGKEIEKWSSADYAERGSWIEMMATSFRTAQGDGDWRGMLGVLRKAVAALAAPRCRSEFHHSQSLLDHDSEIRLRVCAEQQKELRRIVLRVMEALQGFEADQRVDCVLTHLGLLIHRFEQRAGSIQAAACAKQWDRLKMELSRMLPATVDSDDCAVGTGSREIAKVMSSTVAKKRSGEDELSLQGEQRDGPDAGGGATNEETGSARAASKNHKRAKFEDRARIVDDDFQVGTKIKELPTIQHRPEQAKTLQCEACAYQMTSSWFFVHPRSGELRVLAPSNGHAQCTRRSSRAGYFKALDGSLAIRDNKGALDFCPHHRKRTHCVPCAGVGICVHGKRRHRCDRCRQQHGQLRAWVAQEQKKNIGVECRKNESAVLYMPATSALLGSQALAIVFFLPMHMRRPN